MKVRMGFVTNSSSSSYVISFDKDGFDSESVFVQICKRFMIGDGNVLSNVDEVNSYFVSNYGWSKAKTLEEIFKSDEDLKEKHDEIVNEINNGKIVMCRRIDYDDETSVQIIDALAKEKLIKIIEEG